MAVSRERAKPVLLTRAGRLSHCDVGLVPPFLVQVFTKSQISTGLQGGCTWEDTEMHVFILALGELFPDLRTQDTVWGLLNK